MKTNVKQILIGFTFCIMGFSNPLNAQSIYKISNSSNNEMKISGTSTLHDWTMSTKSFTGEARFGFKPGSENELISVKSLTFSIAVLDLKGSENGLDKNAWKALKSEDHKHIVYQLTSAVAVPQKDNKYLLKTRGNLSIAGVTKEITMDVYGVVNKDGTLTFTGSYKMSMTDYGVKRPTFMLGAMKTGDAITLDFTIDFKN